MSHSLLAGQQPRQLNFDAMGTPLSDVTFVVVDLETTGGKPGADAITEIGAVKVRDGEVLGELATLIDPGRGVPPQITELTGISTAMLRDAPPIAACCPASSSSPPGRSSSPTTRLSTSAFFGLRVPSTR